MLGMLVLATFALLVTRADISRDAAREAALAGDLPRALPLARQAVARDPFDPEARSLLSHLLFELAVKKSSPGSGEAQEAEAQALRATELDPLTPHHWNHLGRVLLANGDRQGAYIAMARAARLYPIKIEYRQDRDAVGASLAPSQAGTGAPR